jgi:hypothetical protein
MAARTALVAGIARAIRVILEIARFLIVLFAFMFGLGMLMMRLTFVVHDILLGFKFGNSNSMQSR